MSNTTHLYSVPISSGAPRPGAEEGPRTLIEQGIARTLDADTHIQAVPLFDFCKEKQIEHVKMIRSNFQNYIDFSNSDVSVVLGGDHSVSIGSLASSAEASQNLGVIWFDAHADFNTPESSITGNLHGMSLSTVLGDGKHSEWGEISSLSEENVVLVGVRSIDNAEKERLDDSDITVFSQSDIEQQGISEIITAAVESLPSETTGIHVSFDLDSVDPIHAPGVTTPVQNGVSKSEALRAAKILREKAGERIVALDIVEYNQLEDIDFQTAELGIQFSQTLFG